MIDNSCVLYRLVIEYLAQEDLRLDDQYRRCLEDVLKRGSDYHACVQLALARMRLDDFRQFQHDICKLLGLE